MDLDEGSLKLIDPENLTVMNTQPIHTIRVWGVGRDNGRLVYSNIGCMKYLPNVIESDFWSNFIVTLFALTSSL